MKKVFKNIFLGLALTACTATPLAVGLSFLGKNDAGDASSKNDGSYVLVDELWNNDTRTFNKDNVNILLKYMNLDGKTLSEIDLSTPKNASNFRSVAVSAGSQNGTSYSAKTSSQDINVMLGGLEWTVCYLSQDKSGNPVLTLWLSNTAQDAFAGRENDEGENYGYVTSDNKTALFSDWAYNYSSTSTDFDWVYPTNMYGTSYIRAVTLNNGGQYAVNREEKLSDDVSKDSNSAFALFTMSKHNDGKDLVDYIITPNEMSWQESGQGDRDDGFGSKTPNDTWGEESDSGTYASYSSSEYNYSSREKYDTWKNDKIWLPSKSEIGLNFYGMNTGLWSLSSEQVVFNIITDGTVGTNGGSLSEGDYSCAGGVWLRSGAPSSADWAYIIVPGFSGENQGLSSFTNVSYSYAVRPALHLELSSLFPTTRVTFNANGGSCETSNIVLYSGEKYGTLPTPTKKGYKFQGWFLDEALTQPVTSETIVTNSENHTLYAKWGDWVTYKTYYDYFIDNMGCTGVYADGNLTNVTISAEKKAEILANDFTGSGTSTDPYQVNSSLGFWFMSKFVTLSNKYVELNCDVILNDEQFDENGNVLVNKNGEPIYGDGVVYGWNYVSVCNKMSFYGQNHYISGLYINNDNQAKYTLFCDESTSNGYIALFDSLEITNAFLKGDKIVCAFGYGIDDIQNCKLTNSTLIANEEYCAGLAYGVKRANNCYNFASIKTKLYAGCLFIVVYNKISNCENYGEITGGSVGGITCQAGNNTQIINCKNFGNINYKDRSKGWCGGIVGTLSKNVIIENCENHGDIYGGQNLGGMTSWSAITGYLKIINCANYGDIISEETGTYTLSCCVAGCQLYKGADVLIDGYKNYGAFYRFYSADSCASLFGQVSYDSTYFERTIKNMLTIKNCYLEVDKLKSNGSVFINHIGLGKNLDIRITNNHVKVFNLTNNSGVILLGTTINVNSLELSNLVIDLEEKASNVVINAGGEGGYGDISFKNIVINAGNDMVTWKSMTYSKINYNQDGILIVGDNQKQYYGSSFRDFYVSWRTGKIGLKALDGVGYFQGAIDEEWLGNNGYTKKD